MSYLPQKRVFSNSPDTNLSIFLTFELSESIHKIAIILSNMRFEIAMNQSLFVCVSQANKVRDSHGRTPAAGEQGHLLLLRHSLVVCLEPLPFLVNDMSLGRASNRKRITSTALADWRYTNL